MTLFEIVVTDHYILTITEIKMKTLINFPNNIITNRVNSSKVALAITITVICTMLVITTATGEFDNSSIIPSLTIAAIIIGVISLSIIAFSLKRPVYAKSESPLQTISLDFAESKFNDLLTAAEENRWMMIPSLIEKSDGKAMKLEVVYSKDLSFAAYQFFAYEPHTYEPCSEITYIDKEDIPRINLSNLKS